MAKTKVTPGQCRRCPMCTYMARSEEDYKSHVIQCAMRTFKCTFCSYSSNKQINVKRHEKRCHLGLIEEPIKLDGKPEKSGESSRSKSAEDAELSEEDWLKQDYGDIIGTLSTDSSDEEESKDSQPQKEERVTNDQLLEGRVIRKQTAPTRPHIPKVKIPQSTSAPEVEDTQDSRCDSCKRKISMVDIGIQTDAGLKTIVTRRVKRFREGDIDIEEVVEEKTEFC
ncbi:uncharacterized protein LOC133195163 [Saccostrea echinata]|uniref:uncharacterized protein LOC133195163 n=1 Tax=Saccostrea echinata TaxID=191078 RepID=UPI002A7EF9D3|nr:uncharacterized protein LOC133195163 [Saccostrea echinata]